MLEVNDNIIMEDTNIILLELRKQLELNGIKRFNKIIVSGDNIQTNCPIHKDGQEKKPSFGILNKSKGRDKAGTCHCFGCGWTGSFAEMVSNCFGHDDFGSFGSKWLIKNFLTIKVEERSEIELDISRRTNVNRDSINDFVSEKELDSYRYYHNYMWKRKMTPEIVQVFDIGYDKKTDCLTFPVRDINGNTLFVAKRNVKTKFFNYPTNVEKPVYGLYELLHLTCGDYKYLFPNEFILDEIIICESMINAITCWVYGKPAVALNGTGTQYQYSQLRKMSNRKFILALDPDDAGNRGREKLRKNLSNKIVTEYIIPVGKDINDLSENEFYSLIEIF